MNRIRKSFDLSKAKYKNNKLYSSKYKWFWNFISKYKKILKCFGCNDSFWWKKDISVAYISNDEDEYTYKDYSPKKLRGYIICQQCFVNKSEPELSIVFETVVKPLWMKNKNIENIERVKKYKIYIPVRTTQGLFKKEIINKDDLNGK